MPNPLRTIILALFLMSSIVISPAWASGTSKRQVVSAQQENIHKIDFDETSKSLSDLRQKLWKEENITHTINDFPSETKRDVDIGVAQIDLNKDGKKDAIAQIHSRFHCGAHGCPIYVFVAGKGKKFIDLSLIAPEIWVSEELTNGMRNILTLHQNGTFVTWKWDGEKYQ